MRSSRDTATPDTAAGTRRFEASSLTGLPEAGVPRSRLYVVGASWLEDPEVAIRIGATGNVRSVSLLRWGNVGQKHFSYIPFGGDMHAERRFGELILPSEVSVAGESPALMAAGRRRRSR